MINVHLNGDVVRCPDIREIQKRASEIRDKHNICRYNIFESGCQTWIDNYIHFQTHKNDLSYRRCCLAGCDICPGHIRQRDRGKAKKKFSVNNQVYRKISSAAHYMVKQSKHKTLFVVLSFPKFKIKPNDKQINECFSRFVENLHNNYGVKYYIGVRERGEKTNRVHFHLLFSMRYINFTYLNDAWNHAISNFCEFSPSAFRTKKNNVIIKNPGFALRYACKYFAKQRGATSDSRLIFISNSLLFKKIYQYNTITGEILKDANGKEIYKREPLLIKPVKNKSINDIFCNYKSVFIQQTSDFTTCFRITDKLQFDEFCWKYLYSLFELTNNKTDFTGFLDIQN